MARDNDIKGELDGGIYSWMTRVKRNYSFEGIHETSGLWARVASVEAPR